MLLTGKLLLYSVTSELLTTFGKQPKQ